ncbi:oxidoreductase [Actinorhabdospora filicis]|uniref:Oxidoreductase n=1 Tax=Actinorhabdospora filicis TaxID=1785913 RepID=A0A9W6SR01_9ACTN|nr:molybdopterin-dependent oxidoreductase [Actinorhabdospora filicis]GLZ79136.1 oxidoreductase [Actinorhabdospora filicis]
MAVERWAAALSGVVAACAGLGAGELTAALTGPSGAPLVAVGDHVVRATPEPVKEWAIGVFGTYDKLALQVGTAVLLAVIAAAVGVVGSRRLRYAGVAVALFTAVGVVAAVTREGSGAVDAIPSIVAGLVALAVGYGLLRRAPVAGEKPPWDPRAWDRRRFITVSGLALAGAGAGVAIGRNFGQGTAVEEARNKVALPAPASPAPPRPAGAELGVDGLTPFQTSARDFYRIDTALVPPNLLPADYRLRIHGRCANPIELSYDDLLKRPMIERDITLTCVSNEVGGELVGNARWLGVPLADLLAEVRPDAGADQLVGRSADGWTAGSPTALCVDGRDAMLAVGMNGEPLPVRHGFPVRMVVPGLYGYVSATKWLTELELTSFADFDAYWIPRGWSTPAPIKTESRIDTPRRKATAGKVAVAGVAWAQHRGIQAVELRVDDGPWLPARLSEVTSSDTWRQWVCEWDATPGEHRLTVRATDGGGVVQTEQRAPVAPDGATGLHSVTVDVS